MSKTTTKPAVGYVRMSSDQQQDSPARQRKDIGALAKRLGYRIVRWYEDHGLTGTESSKRKDFQKLLADAKSGAFCAVLLSEQSRMSREDVFDAMVHWKLLRDAGVKIVTCQRGELDFSNLGGVITAIVDQYGAREEAVRLADRSLSGKRLAISQGKKQGGPPYGYDREILDETGRVVRRVGPTEKFRRPIQWASRLVASSDTKAVEAVRTMFEAVAGGASCGAVARQLNRQGVRTMFGKRFNASSVRRTVTNPVYIGTIVAGKKRRRGKFRSLFDDGGIVCEEAHEPLVSRDLFDRAQRMLRRNHKPSKAPTPGRYLLTGVVYLGDGRRLQGGTMSHSDRKVVRRYYTLPPKEFEEHPDEHDRPGFRADTIEHGVLAKLQSFMADERTKRAIRSEITRRTKKAEANVGRLESQIEALRAKIERATENLALANAEDIPGISKLLAGWLARAGGQYRRQAAAGPRRGCAVAGGPGGHRPARWTARALVGGRPRKAVVRHSADGQAGHAAPRAPQNERLSGHDVGRRDRTPRRPRRRRRHPADRRRYSHPWPLARSG